MTTILPRRIRLAALLMLLGTSSGVMIMWGMYGAWVGWAMAACLVVVTMSTAMTLIRPARGAIEISAAQIRRRHPFFPDRAVRRADLEHVVIRGVPAARVLELAPRRGATVPQGARRLLSIPPFAYGMSARELARYMGASETPSSTR